MSNWLEFKKLFPGEQAVRTAFEQLCHDVIKKMYPDCSIESVYESADYAEEFHLETKPRIVYLTKFFTDELTNSRKGQVRKAFSDTFEMTSDNKTKILEWVLCLPYNLNDSEINWWNSWKMKMEEQYHLQVKLFDGEKIIDLLHNFDIYDKWFCPSDVPDHIDEYIKEDNDNEDKLLELEEEELEFIDEVTDEKTEVHVVEMENPETHVIENKLTEEHKTEEKTEHHVTEEKTEKHTEQVHIIENIAEEHKTEETENTEQKLYSVENLQEISHTGHPESDEFDESEDHLSKHILKTFYNLKNQYNNLVTEYIKLTDAEKKFFDKRNFNRKVDKEKFEFDTHHIDLMTIGDLAYKGKTHRINQTYERGLFYYESAYRKMPQEPLQYEEVKKGMQTCENNVVFTQKIFEGDLYFIKGQYQDALRCYEKAEFLDKDMPEIIYKYNQCAGEIMLNARKIEVAKEYFQKAMVVNLHCEEIEPKLKLINHLQYAKGYFKERPQSLLNPVISPIFYGRAYLADRSFMTAKTNFSGIFTKAAFFIGAIALIIIAAYGITLIKMPTFSKKEIATQKLVNAYDIDLQKADEYFALAGNEKVHYFDSAIIWYKRALSAKPYDTLVPQKISSVLVAINDYENQVQQNIKNNPEQYFLSLRDTSEGLKLFKYLYEPGNRKKGKFGYVDANRNIVVAPKYDFNYKKMFHQGENFKNGRALVCLETTPGDTIYFYINKKGERISN